MKLAEPVGILRIEMVCWCFADIIDENLKIALQKELNVMAPGLTIQVLKLNACWDYGRAWTWRISCTLTQPIVSVSCKSLKLVESVGRQNIKSASRVNFNICEIYWNIITELSFLLSFPPEGGPCHQAKDPRVYQKELWTHVSLWMPTSQCVFLNCLLLPTPKLKRDHTERKIFA